MIHRPWKPLDTLLPRLAASQTPRSPGLHASELYALLHPQPKRKPEDEFTPYDLSLYALGGFAIERVLELGLIQLMVDICPGVERPAEIHSLDGIACSPDLFFYEGDEIVVGDIKAKWCSTKGFPLDEEGENGFPPGGFDKHFTQLQIYLYVLSQGTGRRYTKGRIIAYFVCGNWRPPKPRLYAWDLEWSWQEICETWDAIQTIKREREEAQE